jgi:hypothetical protein
VADRSVNFSIYAKDAASKVFKNLQRNMFGLRGAAKQISSDLRAIGIGIGALTAGLIAFGVSAVRGAIADTAATAKLTQALKQRGMATAENLAAVEEMITAGARLAYTDDEVRSSIEAATRFTKSFSAAQRISAVALDLARTTGMSLAEATIAVGKAYTGQGSRLYTVLGIQQKDAKGKALLIKGNAALAAILTKVSGAAEGYAETTEGAFAALQISLSETKESIGKALEPAVIKLLTRLRPLLDRLTQQINDNLPAIERFATRIADKIADLAPRLVGFLERAAPKIARFLSDGKKSLGDFGDTAEDLFGENGRLTVALAAIGAAFRGLSGAIAGALTAQGVDPITAYLVGAVSSGVITGVLSGLASTAVTAAIARFGGQVAAASSTGASGGATTALAAAGGGIGAALTAITGFGAAASAALIAIPVVALAALSSAIQGWRAPWDSRGAMDDPAGTTARGVMTDTGYKVFSTPNFVMQNPAGSYMQGYDPMRSVNVYLGADRVADPLEKIIVDRVRAGGGSNNY